MDAVKAGIIKKCLSKHTEIWAQLLVIHSLPYITLRNPIDTELPSYLRICLQFKCPHSSGSHITYIPLKIKALPTLFQFPICKEKVGFPELVAG